MKILFVSDALSMHTRRWAEYFRDQGHEVHIASFRPAELKGIEVHLLPTYGLGKLGYLLATVKLRSLYKQLAPDIVHAQYVTSYGFLAALARLRPLVLTAWGTDVLISPWQSRVLRAFARFAVHRADALNTVAEHMNAAMYRLGAPAGSVDAIPFGVDATFFVPDPAYRPGEPVRIISTRNFAPVYNVDTLITALGMLHAAGIAFEADLVGDGPLRAELEEQVRQAGLTSKVRFRGHVTHEQLRGLLAGADIFVTSALSDGNNVSLNEAMACGCFPVATRIPANEQWISHDRNGLLYEPGDAAGLARALEQALMKRADWASVRQTNRNIVETRADWRVCTKKMEAVYQRLNQRQPG